MQPQRGAKTFSYNSIKAGGVHINISKTNTVIGMKWEWPITNISANVLM